MQGHPQTQIHHSALCPLLEYHISARKNENKGETMRTLKNNNDE